MAFGGLDYTNLERYLQSYGEYIVRQAGKVLKKRKQSGHLLSTLDYTVYKDSKGRRTIRFFSAPYGEFIEKGVRGTEGRRTYINMQGQRRNSPYKYTNKMPPVDTLAQWVKAKGMKGRDAKGKFISHRSLAFAIAKKIQKKGIKATSHYTQPISYSMKRFKKEMLQNFGKDVLKGIVLPFKES